MKLHVVLLVVVGLVLAPYEALAAPPTLLSVGQTGRHLTATWSLAPGAESAVIEAATSPNVGSDGYFFRENVSHFDTLQATQTSYVGTGQVDPGLHYVHVASYQPDCLPCPFREWSNVLTIAIPPDPTPPPPPDKVKPVATLGGSSAQRLGTLYVRAAMTEPGTLTARATVSVPKASKVYRFTPVARSASANARVKLRLKLSSRGRRTVKRALRRGKKLRARVTVIATDNAGNSTVARRVIRLKP